MCMKLTEVPQKCPHNSYVRVPCFWNDVPTKAIYPYQRNHRQFLMTGEVTAYWMDDSRRLLQIYWKCFCSTAWKKNVKFPVTFFVDGHPSYISAECTVLRIGHNLGLAPLDRHKAPPTTGSCNCQATKNGLENSSARVAQAKQQC